jgi:hypothetical protein
MIVWGGCCDDAHRGLADGAGLHLPRDPAVPLQTPEGDGEEIALEPEDADFGMEAIIALAGLVLLAVLVASARAIRKRSRPVD